mmetsp:Transcript_80699/g.261563  ORF Transcript_80699/g.261563 Transcript_80699/m.261563 type:complete len:273 (-) Transcript_80699:70-888(-)
MKNLAHPALNRHIKMQARLFYRMYDVAQDVARKSTLERAVRQHMAVVDRFPTVLDLINDMFLAVMTSSLKIGAHNCHVSIRPLYTILMPSLMQKSSDAKSDTVAIMDKVTKPPESVRNAGYFHEDLSQLRDRVHEGVCEENMRPVPMLMPEKRRVLASEEETDNIRAGAICYVEELVKVLNKNVSMSLDTFIMHDLREELTNTTARDAFKKLPEDSYFMAFGTFEAAIEDAFSKDVDSLEMQHKKEEKEKEFHRIRDALEAVVILASLRLDA